MREPTEHLSEPTDVDGICVFCGGENSEHVEPCEYLDACNNYERVKAQRDKLAAALKSILEWWEDDHDKPQPTGGMSVGTTKDLQISQWLNRRLALMANCARAALAELGKDGIKP